jgi:ligand-binding sensor domain-containing protein/signal transduction histidine kinase
LGITRTAIASGGNLLVSDSGNPLPTHTPSSPRDSLSEKLPPLDTTENIFFERIGLDEGLSSGAVNVILQDNQGFLWFGTEDGLNRYDGYQFKTFRPDSNNPNSLTDGWITALFQTSSGELWIGTRSGGLNRFDPTTGIFNHYTHDSKDPKSLISNRVQVIYQDERGRLWIGTDRGLDQFYFNSETFKHYYSSAYQVDEPFGDDITAIISDLKGFLLVGTNGSGLKRFNPLTGVFTIYAHDNDNPFSISNNFVTAIQLDRNGNAWIGTQDGLNLYDPTANFFNPVFYHYNHSAENSNTISDNTIHALYLDTNGDLWVGTNGGLDHFHRKTRSFISHQHEPRDGSSLSFDIVSAIYQDRGGVLWVGTDGAGLNKYVRGRDKFAYFSHQDTDPFSLSGNIISHIFVDPKGYVWIGTRGNGLNRMHPRTGNFDHFSHIAGSTNTLSSNDIYALVMDSGGELWIGTDLGLDRLDLKRAVFTNYQHVLGDPNSLQSSPVLSLFADRDGKIWVGHNEGLSIFDPLTEIFTHYLPDPREPASLSGGQVNIIFQDSMSRLWVGTLENGLNRFNPQDGTFIHYLHDPNDPNTIVNNSIQTIFEDSRGNLWIGTNGGGLNLFHPETDSFTHYQDLHGLPSNIIYGIVEDDAGYLWLSTNYGISRFDPIIESFSNYAAQDGLQGNEFNPGAYANGLYGEIYFGGINGLTVFDPLQVTTDEYQPPLVLTAFTQDNQPVELESSVEYLENITLVWPDNYFEFEFAALGFSRPENNQYAYMLENYDTDWFYAGNQRFGRYASLPGGEYTLLLKAANPDGVWSEESLAIKITVIPPFWQTNWFRVVVALAAGFLVLVVYWINLNRIQNRSRELENLIRERTADLQKYTEELEALYSADEKMLRTQTISHVYQVLVDVAIQMLHADGGAVLEWQAESTRFQCVVCEGYTDETRQTLNTQLSILIGKDVPPQFSTMVIAPTGNQAQQIQEEKRLPYIALQGALAKEEMHTTLLLPIYVDQQLLAVYAASFIKPEILLDDLYRLLLALVQRASLSIQNAELFERSKELAILEERNRLARDLHDSAKQKAFAALAQLGAANGILKSRPEAVHPFMREAENLVYDVIQELTFLIQEMYPMGLKEKGLSRTLRDYIFEWEGRSDIEVKLMIENEKKMPLEKSQAIYRIVQESLANIARHSKASHASVQLTYQDTLVQVEVEDNGCGFELDQKSNGMGLRSINERVEGYQGELDIQTMLGGGTKITVRIPLEKELE